MRFACIYLLIYLYIAIINSIIIFIFYFLLLSSFTLFYYFYACNGDSPQKIKAVIHTMYCTIMSLASKDHESLANQ